jgi:hypothetical protein
VGDTVIQKQVLGLVQVEGEARVQAIGRTSGDVGRLVTLWTERGIVQRYMHHLTLVRKAGE